MAKKKENITLTKNEAIKYIIEKSVEKKRKQIIDLSILNSNNTLNEFKRL